MVRQTTDAIRVTLLNPLEDGPCSYCGARRWLTVRVEGQDGAREARGCQICAQDTQRLRKRFRVVATPSQARLQSVAHK